MARRPLVILTGAGVSAESGVPTFRGAEGLWRSYRPEELATPQAFARDPRLVWEWYDWRRSRIVGCAPNPAHYAIAQAVLGSEDVHLVTQNVDGLHLRAMREIGGSVVAAKHLPVELHGSLFRTRCTECHERRESEGAIDTRSVDALPRCECGGLLRPDVVWFGESLVQHVLEQAMRLAENATTCLVVGTSAVVYPAAALPLQTSKSGGSIIEVNPDPTPLTPHATGRISDPAGVVLPFLLH